MSSSTKEYYDFEYTYDYDPLNTHTKATEQVKAEQTLIKLEAESTKFDDRINSDSDYDEKPLSNVFAESIKIKNVPKEKKRFINKSSMEQNKKMKKKQKYLKMESNAESNSLILIKEQQKNMKCFKVDKKLEESKVMLNEKFETVMFTEEEMLKCREEKRNQPNFKKIPFKCNSCVTGFTKMENYELHRKKVHDEVKFRVGKLRSPFGTLIVSPCLSVQSQSCCRLRL